ncbi:MAG: hypothetical protein EOM10_16400, partial [Opitutae bacterium]|nr:hypothetical protein [Opitutae bacterium]
LVGAYQETLGDLHNLLGDTNVLHVRVGKDGTVEYANEIAGDAVADVLSYVEYDPREMINHVRTMAEQPLVWRTRAAHGPTVPVQLLAINDFHGQVSSGEQVSGRPVGSGPVLAAYLREAQETAPGRTFLVHAGDHVGASPPQSTLLQDEPAIQFFNLMGNEHCRTGGAPGPDCNLLGVPGNHELDEGVEELLRLVHGGNHPHGPFLQNPYRGAAFPYLSANLVHAATDEPLFRPAVVRQVDGIKIAFIGAILRQAGQFLPPERLAGLRVLDEAEAINRQVRRLRDEQGVRAFVVIMHQGGLQHAEPPADGTAPLVGDIAGVVDRLDPDVDVVQKKLDELEAERRKNDEQLVDLVGTINQIMTGGDSDANQ